MCALGYDINAYRDAETLARAGISPTSAPYPKNHFVMFIQGVGNDINCGVNSYEIRLNLPFQ